MPWKWDGEISGGIAAPVPALADSVSLDMLGVRYFQRDVQFSRLWLHSLTEKILFLPHWTTHLVFFPWPLSVM